MPAFVTTDYVDDLDDTEIDAKDVDTVEFSYRGNDFTLVLTKRHGSQFDKDIEPWIKAAKKAQAQLARTSKTKPAARIRKSTGTNKAAAPGKTTAGRKAAPGKTTAGRKAAPARTATAAIKTAPSGKAAPARKAASPRKAAAGKAAVNTDERSRAKAIRAWATANGHKVSERGRISASVAEAFDAAH